MRRRIYYLGLAVTAIALLQLVRLAWLQWLPHYPAAPAVHHYRDQSVNQRERGLILDTGRADFVDRKGRALTGETVMVLAAFPVSNKLWAQTGGLDKLAAILETNPATLFNWLSSLKEPGFYHEHGGKLPYRLSSKQLEQLVSLRLEGIRVLPYHVRYKPPYSAMHAIGYISQHPEWLETLYSSQLEQGKLKLNDRIGGAGLEKSLDLLLQGIGGVAVSHFTDGVNRPLHGLDMRLTRTDNPYYPLRVVTTLDLELQKELEMYVDKQGLKDGAVVVLDANNADIVAMVSRPAYDPYRLDASGREMINHAIHAIAPGSVFKLVTEAAALEAGQTSLDEVFHCNGEYGKYGLSCWKQGGHGTLTLREALAKSCNIAFAHIGERLQYDQFMQTADRLGLGKQIGWESVEAFKPLGQPLRLLGEEEGGRLFAELSKQRDGGLLAQTAIGQRDVAVSPLQAANLIVTLLHNGQVRAPRIVSEIRYANGHLMSSLPVRDLYSPYGKAAPATIRALLAGMEDVVAYGTGASLQGAKWRLAGKSGTAQTLQSGKEREHQWFVGYGPVQAPRYAVAVVAENRLPGSRNQSTALFRGVMDILAGLPSG
ncbi:penicillin-binding protein [Paenibacillus sp. MAHUQ-46]|uniref:Penicillin-binding protein n=2 Tax=Paenibacillus TaxID=44249 RepID=A0A934J761_9BACL|nr:penicillin-binding protein [Paenibacillus roseus]